MRRALVIAALVACAGCWGRPVIGEIAVDDAPPEACEDDGLNCVDWGEAPEFPGLDGGVLDAPVPCSDEVVEMRIGDDVTGPLEAPLEVAGLDGTCGTLRLTMARGARDVVLLAPSLDRGRLEIASEGDSIVTLSSAVGDDAHVVLEGTSTLRLRTLRGLSGWRIDAATGARGWDVEIEDCELREVALRTDEDASVLVRQSRLEGATIATGALSLQGGVVDGAWIDARELITSGVDVRESDVRARFGSLGSGIVDGTKIYGCESILVRETSVERTDFGPCTAAPLQLNNASVSRSIVRGRSFSVQTRFIEAILGGEPGSSVSLVDSRVAYSLLCGVESLSARGGSVLTCARCAPDSPRAACIDEASAVTVVACPSLALAEVCTSDLPPSLTDPDAGLPEPATAPNPEAP